MYILTKKYDDSTIEMRISTEIIVGYKVRAIKGKPSPLELKLVEQMVKLFNRLKNNINDFNFFLQYALTILNKS